MADVDQTDEVSEIQENLISRGEKEEIKVDLSKVEKILVFDGDGNGYRFGDLYKEYKTIVIFVRHFLCHMCKEYVDDLAKIPSSFLKDSGTRMIVVGCGPYKYIKPFMRETGYKFIMVTEPTRELHKAMGLLAYPTVQPKDMKASKHVKSNFFTGVLKSTWRGMSYRELQGDINQQGGSFIIGPGPVVHHYHIDRSPLDHAPINDLLCIAGVPQVNFEKDRRVISL